MKVYYQIEWIYEQAKDWARIPTVYENGDVAKANGEALADQCPNANVRVVRIEPEVVWVAA